MGLVTLNKRLLILHFFFMFFSCALPDTKTIYDNNKSKVDDLLEEGRNIASRMPSKEWLYSCLSQKGTLEIHVRLHHEYGGFFYNLEDYDRPLEDKQNYFFYPASEQLYELSLKITESSAFKAITKEFIELGFKAAYFKQNEIFLTNGKDSYSGAGNVYYKGLLFLRDFDGRKIEEKINDSLYVSYESIR